MALINQNNKMTYSPVGFAPTTFTKEEWQTKIMQAEDVLLNIEGHCNGPDEADIAGIGTLKHYFVKDAYVREITMEAGAIFTSQIHKYEHPFFVMEGDCDVLTEDGVANIKAPYWGITKPETKRLLFINEKTVWVTVHATDKTNIKDVNKDIMYQSLKQLKTIKGKIG